MVNTTNDRKESEMPRYACHRAEGAIEIDGLLNEPDWQRAPANHNCGLLNRPGTTSPLYFEFRALWAPDHLYLAFVADASPVPITFRQDDEALFNECAVELFVADDQGGYYEIEFNPLGAVLDFHCPAGADDSQWRALARDFTIPGLQRAVAFSADGSHWTVEAAIPFAALSQANQKPWRVNFARSQRMPDGSFDLTTWAPTEGKFADVSHFGFLDFLP